MATLEQVPDHEWRKKVEDRLGEHFDGLTELESRLNRGNERFATGEKRMSEIETKLDANTVLTAKIAGDTGEILKIFKAFQGFVLVGGWLGNTIKWTVGVVIACGIAWYFLKTGELPKKP
jgi:hypothetical protein